MSDKEIDCAFKKLKDVERNCIRNGVRLTDKRKLILSGLLTSGKPMSAYELAGYCKQETSEVMPVASVYRMLEFFQQKRLVQRLSLANKYVFSEHSYLNHCHEGFLFLICVKCQKVKKIQLGNIIEELKQGVLEAGFDLMNSQLEINCVCDDCINATA